MDREPKRISAEEAERDIHEVLARVSEGEAFAVTREGETIAEIAPPPKRNTVGDFLSYIKGLPDVDLEENEALARDQDKISKSDSPSPSKWD